MSYRLPRTASSRRSYLHALLIAILLTLACMAYAQPAAQPAPPTQAASPKPVASEEWIALYFGQQKIGYSVTRTAPATYLDMPALQETTHGVTKITLLGSSVEEDEDSESITDLKHQPLKQIVDVKSNGSALHVEALFDYAAHKVHCTVGSGSDATHKTLTIPDGANLTSDTSTLTEGKELSAGQKLTFYYLDPLSVELRAASLEVFGKKIVRSDSGKNVSAFEVRADLHEGKMIGWAEADGTLLKSEVQVGGIAIDSGARVAGARARYRVQVAGAGSRRRQSAGAARRFCDGDRDRAGPEAAGPAHAALPEGHHFGRA